MGAVIYILVIMVVFELGISLFYSIEEADWTLDLADQHRHRLTDLIALLQTNHLIQD